MFSAGHWRSLHHTDEYQDYQEPLTHRLGDPPNGGGADQVDQDHRQGSAKNQVVVFTHDAALPFFLVLLISSKTVSVAATKKATSASAQILFI
jgi:hypothetical protein